MKVLDILNAPWAIVPEKLIEIREIYLRHSRGEEADIATIEAALGRPLANDPQPYEVDRGVAVVDVAGVLAKRMDMFMQISGGTSTRTVARNFSAAMLDAAVHSIILNVDSPGGEVDGTQELSNLISGFRGQGKPILGLADGMAASAGYWIISAADKVFASDRTTMLGSIGVIATHVDVTKANEMRGIKVTHITAGKFKGIGSPHKPLDREGEDVIHGILDQIYSEFVQDVAAHRGFSVEKVLADMADGRELIGEKAVDAGLADGIASREELIVALNREHQARLGGQAMKRAMNEK
jgi:signal peptide peptidase SppA